MNIIKYKYLFLGLSGLLVVASVVVILVFGLKQGIDFTGGTLWQIKIDKSGIATTDVANELRFLKQTDFTINTDATNNSYLIRMKELPENPHQEYLKAFKEKFGNIEELSFETIGSAIGQEIRSSALWAFLLVLLAISLYVAFAFRKVSSPVSSWKYGIITLLTLFHDAIIPAGLFAYLGYLNGIEIGVNFIVSVLVVMGFSVHDTIVVFDRIRENLKLEKSTNFDFGELVNRSIVQTFARSLNTSLTLVLVLLALYFLGATSLGYFTLIILVGTIVGTYSSIFVASPLLVLWQRNK